ncbi:aminomethyl-transferring glycine dehydrogenase subunit GcvPB [Thiotrichales bacterium 19S9-12]|nr:aminomethyl-transferring glycine dehydrogenase subunit GcvPB [Thiotrichales bacterium 19S9-11]MCF6812320.1 aminomethyl-transferring glycine dehydrogenase subunit GcvPB [Thiotrichales bacterium 19S9-12]
MLIFEKSKQGRFATAQAPYGKFKSSIDQNYIREDRPMLPEVSELEAIRHFTKLSRKNFSIDTHFYPLGSCTMKYNPRAAHKFASIPNFLQEHPLASDNSKQGFYACMYDLQEYLLDITGMKGVSLAPMAGAQGEFAGIAMIRRYHEDRSDHERSEIIVPDAAHGTNPATAIMCGYKVREVKTLKACGDVDVDALKAALGPQTAGIMLTNPSTLGVFERRIKEIADMVHEVGGLLYYDGANLNAIMGKTRPGDMGFDVMHLNLHKTFATPHGGGGPGAGPVACAERLKLYLPTPLVVKKSDDSYALTSRDETPQSIGRLSAFAGNAGILLRAYIYIRMLGRDGLKRVSEMATLNANYMLKRLTDEGFNAAFPSRRATHEFIITLEQEKKDYGVTATDFAKCLIDRGLHAPTMYFPLLVPECLLIEPTETETKEQMDEFIQAMIDIREIAKKDPDYLKNAPYNLPNRRLDDVKAARHLDVVYSPEDSGE